MSESRSGSQDSRWIRSPMDVWHDLLYLFNAGGPDGEPPPPVPVVALLMIRTGLDMALWALPEGAVAEAANAVRGLPDELAGLIARAMSSSLLDKRCPALITPFLHNLVQVLNVRVSHIGKLKQAASHIHGLPMCLVDII